MAPYALPMNRRRMICQSGVFAMASQLGLSHMFAASPQGRAKRCLVLWMNGGPSQMETLDPKPGEPNGGPTRSIATAIPGIHISEHLPKVAAQMERIAVLRNLSSTEGEHQRASYALHTGFSPVPTFPRPTLGSIISHETDNEPFPKFVSFGDGGFGPAFLGAIHAPWNLSQPREALQLLRNLRKKRHLLSVMSATGKSFAAKRQDPVLAERQSTLKRLEHMVESRFVEALDLDRESKATRGRYGQHEFGKRCLAARRLLQAGVRFVEVQLSGWDTHQNNFNATARLCAQLDSPWAALLEDLESDGMLDETLVVWMGEFGRTPRINSNAGRDHFPAITPVAVAGGGTAGGQAIGATSTSGDEVDGQQETVANLFASLLHAFNIPPNREFTTTFGSPTQATDNGQVIEPLFAPSKES